MVADLGCREDVFLGGEVSADLGEDFRRYTNGDVE